MESLLLLLGMSFTVVFIYWSAMNDAKPPGERASGLFGYREGREPRAKLSAAKRRRKMSQSIGRPDRPAV